MDGPARAPKPSGSSNIIDSSVISEAFPYTGSSDRWHPKLTVHRALIIGLTTGFGLAKAILTYRGQTIAPITIEWVFGVIVVLVLSWLELHERTNPHIAGWLFQNDLAPLVWKFLGLLKCPTPNYRTEERELTMLIQKPHPPLTGYRILLSIVVATFGLAKAILSFSGKLTAVTTIDWIFGVVVMLSLYWLGLYERSSQEVLPVLFETDYATVVENFLAHIVKVCYHVGFMLLHVVVMVLAYQWTQIGVQGLFILWSTKIDSPSSAFEHVHWWSSNILSFTGACVVVGSGVVGFVVAFASFAKHLLSICKQGYLRLVALFKAEDAGSMEERSFTWTKLTLPRFLTLGGFVTGPAGTALKVLHTVLVILGYIVGHAVVLTLCFGMSFNWLYALVQAWKDFLAEDDTGVSSDMFMGSFILLWSGTVCGGIVTVLYGAIMVLGSLFSLVGRSSSQGYTLLQSTPS